MNSEPDNHSKSEGAAGGYRLFVVAFALSIAVGAGGLFLVLSWTGSSNVFVGCAMAGGFGGLGVGLVLWAHRLMRADELTGPREAISSGAAARAPLLADFTAGDQPVQRRRLLDSLVAVALGTLTLGLISMFRSLARQDIRVLKKSVWKQGQRLVTEQGQPVTAEMLLSGGMITVFPEGRLDGVHSQTLLIRVEESLLRLPAHRRSWAPRGYLAYSRICTHAGCPVGLYEATSHILLCPCHQSTFDVLACARPTSGPAARALPQLPLYIDDKGQLRAAGDFNEPPGPGSWRLLS